MEELPGDVSGNQATAQERFWQEEKGQNGQAIAEEKPQIALEEGLSSSAQSKGGAMQISKSIVHRIRILLTIAVILAIYRYIGPMWAFGAALYCILVDQADTAESVEELLEERKTWKNFLTNRRGF